MTDALRLLPPPRAAALSERLLAPLGRRWRHVECVARRAGTLNSVASPEERSTVVTAAWLHDVGYAPAVVVTGSHPLDGARVLLAEGGVARAKDEAASGADSTRTHEDGSPTHVRNGHRATGSVTARSIVCLYAAITATSGTASSTTAATTCARRSTRWRGSSTAPLRSRRPIARSVPRRARSGW